MENKELKYQYVVIQGDYDYYSLISVSSENKKEAIYVNGLFDVKNRFLKKVLRNIYYRLEDKKKHKWKKLLLPFMFHRKLGSKPVCFLIWSWYANDVEAYLGKYLRKKYKNCKIVCRFEDIIEKMPYWNIESYRNSFDYLFSFDELDARKYNISFFPSWYDANKVEEKVDIEYDFLFVGRAKDRFDEIVELYNCLTSFGYKCYFYLVEVPKEKQIDNGIVYGSYIPYSQMLNLVKKCRCLVEIIQKDSNSETLRVFEAIFYDKMLITNNQNIKNKSYYNPDYIFIYDKLDNLKNVNISSNKDVHFSEDIKNEFRPYSTFLYLDKQL